jgi:succinate dehydrogenase / fumarate reductase flavoprotein subunit
METLVGIIRTEPELRRALEEIDQFRRRLARVGVVGNRQYNPGWHLALDLHSMLTVAEAVTRSALERKESRGGHARDDYPGTDARFAQVNIVNRLARGELQVTQEPLPEMPDEMRHIVEEKS